MTANASDLPSDWFERIKAAYPKREGGHGWPIARAKILASIANGASYERILAGTVAYAAHCRKKGQTGTEFVQQARTFYGPGQWWDEYADMDIRTVQQVAEDTEWSRLKAKAAKEGFRQPVEGESIQVYNTLLERHRLRVVK